jgi:hypothetical protein
MKYCRLYIFKKNLENSTCQHKPHDQEWYPLKRHQQESNPHVNTSIVLSLFISNGGGSHGILTP